MKTVHLLFRVALAIAVCASPLLHAVPPPGILNHQGRVVVSGVNHTGTGHFKFALVDGAGTTTLWSNDGTGTGGAQPTAAVPVAVSQGHYALGLGDTALSGMTVAVPPSVFTGNADVRLRVWFSTSAAGPFEQLTPDRRITAAGYALTAGAVADPSFLGTTGITPLDLSVNNQRGLRIQPSASSPSLIGGSAANMLTQPFPGSVIGGGGGNGSAAEANIISASSATIAGGRQNVVSSSGSSIGGGRNNQASGVPSATIAGGENNRASGGLAAIGGGASNVASGSVATVAGGTDNVASGASSAVPGGTRNVAGGQHSFAAGLLAKAVNNGAFVWGDSSVNTDFASTGDNQFLIRAAGGVGIGKNNPQTALDVAGTVTATAFSGNGSGLTGIPQLGGNNIFTGTIRATGFEGTGAPLTLGTTDAQPVDFSVNGLRAFRLQPSTSVSGPPTPSLIGGFSGNSIDSGAQGAVIAGGGGAGAPNTISGGGGFAFIGGGLHNTASAFKAVVGGGELNVASGQLSTVPGGGFNLANGFASFAAGHRAKAIQRGTFVWADSQDADFTSTADNQFLIRASGGVGINTTTPGGALGIQVPISFENNSATVSFTGEDFTPALVMSGGPAPGILRLRHGLEVWPNTNGTAAGFVDVRNASGAANIVLKGDTGRVGVGTNNPVVSLHVVGDVRVDSGGFAGKVEFGGGGIYIAGLESWMRLQASNVGIGLEPASLGARLQVSGNASKTTAGDWLANSDRRIKQDIQPVESALDTLNRVRLVSFRYTDQYRDKHPAMDDRRYLNVVAQEFAEVFPDHVKSSGEKLPDGSEILQVDTWPVTIYSAAAIQELDVKQRQLRAEKDRQIGELKAENAALQERLARLERAVEAMQRTSAAPVGATATLEGN